MLPSVQKSEKTLLLIKPDAVRMRRTGEIIKRLEQTGFTITGLRMTTLDRDQAEAFYAVHRGKEFFDGLVQFICSGPLVAVLLEGEDCRARVRRFVGATDPARAEPGTIRAEFGTSLRMNAVHASNPEEDVEREVVLMFPGSVVS